MKKAVIATLVLGTVFAVVPAGSAQAQAEGILCGFTTVTDPTGEADVQTGEIDGGPLTATSTDPNAPSADPSASLTLRCVIQVGPVGATYAGTDAVSASAAGTGAVVLPPTSIAYVSPEGANVYLCTELDLNGVQYYFDYTNSAWSQSNSVECSLAISQVVALPGLVSCTLGLIRTTDVNQFVICVIRVTAECTIEFIETTDVDQYVGCML